MKVYLDNMIVSGKVRSDLGPQEMTAVEGLIDYKRRGLIQPVTSRESWREQEGTVVRGIAPRTTSHLLPDS
jgi:hypothetical protein